MPFLKSSKLSRRSVLFGAPIALSAGAGGWWAMRRYTPPHENLRLSVQDAFAKAQSGEIVLVDIRTPTEWRQTGVPLGAVPLDMRRPDFTTALLTVTKDNPDVPVALICAGGVRSARLTLRLTQAGFARIADVPEGMFGSASGPGWINSKLPITPWQG